MNFCRVSQTLLGFLNQHFPGLDIILVWIESRSPYNPLAVHLSYESILKFDEVVSWPQFVIGGGVISMDDTLLWEIFCFWVKY